MLQNRREPRTVLCLHSDHANRESMRKRLWLQQVVSGTGCRCRSAIEQDNMGGHRLREVQIVGAQQNGTAVGQLLAHQSHKTLLMGEVEMGRRFVEKQHRRPLHQSRPDSDALALATGQTARVAVHQGE